MRIKYRVHWDSETGSHHRDWDDLGDAYQHAANTAHAKMDNVRVVTVKMKAKALPNNAEVWTHKLYTNEGAVRISLDTERSFYPSDARRIARAILRAAKEAEKGAEG